MPIYSHSRISCFEQCPFRFRLKYIDKVRPEIEQTVEAFMGTLVHKALEKLYNDLRFKKMNKLPELIRFYDEQWKKNWNDGRTSLRRYTSPFPMHVLSPVEVTASWSNMTAILT